MDRVRLASAPAVASAPRAPEARSISSNPVHIRSAPQITNDDMVVPMCSLFHISLRSVMGGHHPIGHKSSGCGRAIHSVGYLADLCGTQVLDPLVQVRDVVAG